MNSRKILLVAALVGGLGSLLAQSDRGTIEGTITDPSGAAVPQAQIQIIQVETNHVFDFGSNDLGVYFAANLPLGTYRVIVKKEGFHAARREPVLIQAQTRARVDFTLAVGSVAESVDVAAAAPLLDLATPTLVTGITTKFIQDLPMIQIGEKRNITGYLQSIPGIANPGSTTPILNGSASGNSEIFIDGAAGSEVNYPDCVEETGPAIEHVGEFSVVTNSFDAEYGRTGTWFTSVTIRSGTNEVHGAVFNDFANDKLDARSFFQATRQRVRQNEGGFTLGGPVYIPKVYNGHNRTFFFFGQDLFWMRQSGTGALQTIPTTAFRNGDFSSLRDASGAVIPIYDPATTMPDGSGSYVRTPFPGNVVPKSRFSPIASQIIALMPNPDLPSQSNNWYNRTGTWPYLNTYVSTIKVDHSVSDRQKMSVTYSDQRRPRLLNNQGWGQTAPVLEGFKEQQQHDQMARVNYDYILRPNLLSHFTVGFDRYFNPTKTETIGANWDQKLGLTGFPWDDGSFPVISFSGGTAAPLGLGGSTYSITASGRYSYNENLTWVRGHHTTKYGVGYMREYNNQFSGPNGAGNFAFTNATTSQPDGGSNFSKYGNAFASFLLGNVNQANMASPVETGRRWRYWSFFAQDEWHVTQKLTLSYGLRWELYPSPFDVNNVWSTFSPTTPNPGAGGIPGALIFAGFGQGRTGNRTFSPAFNKAAAPRLAVAYGLDSKTVVRASGGIYYAPASLSTSVQTAGFQATPSFSSPDGFSPLYNWDTGTFPQNYARPPFIDPTFSNGLSATYIGPDYARPPQILSWTFSIERQLANNLALDASYLGSHSTHLVMNSPLDVVNAQYLALGPALTQSITSAQAASAGVVSPFPTFATYPTHTVAQALMPFPQYTSVSYSAGVGTAHYDSLQIKVTKRYSNGLNLLAFYTWMKNLTDAEGTPQYPLNRLLDTSISSNGAPQVFTVSAAYDLPFGKGKRFLASRGLAQRVAGGWTLVAIVRRASGDALSPTTSNNLSILGYGSKRGSLVLGQPIHASYSGSFDPAKDLFLNPAAFSIPGTYSMGTDARVLDWARGPEQASESIAMSKRIAITEKVNATLRGEAQNPFNLVRWGDPVTSLTDANFGKITSAQTGRVIQLHLEVQF